MNCFEEVLHHYWGYRTFRPLQQEIIEKVYAGEDVLGLMPTGGGKSITFQVPAMMKEGVCLVITPLIALMKDQVDNLRKRGIRAASVHSGMRAEEIVLTLDNVINGPFKFLYLSPERLSTFLFRTKAHAIPVSMIVVDEAHCISQWGYDFRPAYLKIAELRDIYPDVPVLALTATAPPEVVEDIQRNLRFRHPQVLQKSFVRDNLHYVVRRTDNKEAEMIHILTHTDGSAIVYTRNRKRTEEMALSLQKAGITAEAYHAGLKSVVKNERQTAWQKGDIRVMVATNAFGMGIDKPDVRVVIHLETPSSLEEYYQEAGRAGRDEQRAFCVLLYDQYDPSVMQRRIGDSFPERDFIKEVYEMLGSYLQVAVDSGFEATFDFELGQFCQRFKLPISPTDHALEILDMAGYLSYSRESERQSRVMITVMKPELYKLQGVGEKADRVIQDLLRNYTGLFADFVYIVEEEIERRCGITLRDVFEALITLARRRVITYIPRKNLPQITYTQRREEKRYLFLSREILEDRRGRFEKRLQVMMDYLTQTEGCRVDSILHYFGEKSSGPCGMCDLCLSRSKSGTRQEDEHQRIGREILQLSEQGVNDPEQMLSRIKGSREVILSVLRRMIDEGQLSNMDGSE